MRSTLLVLTFATLGTAASPKASSTDFEQQCASFIHKLALGNATVYFTEAITAGTNLSLPDNDPTCTRPYQVVSVDLCRVALFAPTSSTSNISMEAWLPRNWTGRFLSTGNGGVSGCIQYEDLAYTAALGFSTVATNNGHNGTSGAAFLNNDGVVEDFAYRAVHLGVALGKQISHQFYGKVHNKSYYLGCSTGGRQGFKEVQAFPDDFDGVVAGAPAFAFNNLSSWSGHFYAILQNVGQEGIPPTTAWPTIHQEILNQCDEIDGYKDGIIEDPMLCNFRPESLICASGVGSGNKSTCLTGAQTATVRALLSDLYGESGSGVYPHMQPGSELGDANIYYSGKPFPYSTDWFR